MLEHYVKKIEANALVYALQNDLERMREFIDSE
jgi:hypothetical protein